MRVMRCNTAGYDVSHAVHVTIKSKQLCAVGKNKNSSHRDAVATQSRPSHGAPPPSRDAVATSAVTPSSTANTACHDPCRESSRHPQTLHNILVNNKGESHSQCMRLHVLYILFKLPPLHRSTIVAAVAAVTPTLALMLNSQTHWVSLTNT
jgi:hypothetical protein